MTTTPQSEIRTPQPADDAPQALPAPDEQPVEAADRATIPALVPSLSALALGFLSLEPIRFLATGSTHIHS